MSTDDNITEYNKLVRDRIPEIIENNGERFVIHRADRNEFRERLRDKLVEEAKEFRESGSIRELADIFEVISNITDVEQIPEHEIISTKNAKAEERGRFDDRIVLERVIEEPEQ